MEADLAVDGGPDHRPPVGSLEVPLHDLVQLPVTEHHRLQLETLGSQKINRLLIFIRKSKHEHCNNWPLNVRLGWYRVTLPERVVVPSELQPF